MAANQKMKDFAVTVWEYYDQHGRFELPWRQPEPSGDYDPYKIMVSEIMLQQTQVSRVIPKYEEFLRAFPTTQALAAAPQAEVLRQWSGLGYNRRARFLHQAAQQIENTKHVTSLHKFPTEITELVKLPGIGKNTAAAIRVYAFDLPATFVETNIRTVYIHHFFNDETAIHDTQLVEFVKASLPDSNYREWYWALMDYGSYLKATAGNNIQRSHHYVRQSRFEGSRRQIRGQILRLLGAAELTYSQLADSIDDERLTSVLDELVAEQLITSTRDGYRL